MMVKRLACLLALLSMALGFSAFAVAAEEIQIETVPNAACFTFEMAEQQFVYVEFATKNDTGSMVLYGKEGLFGGVCYLPGTMEETELRLTVHALNGKVLLRATATTQKGEQGAPAAGLDTTVRAASTARNVSFSAQKDGLHYDFSVPGREQVILRCKTAQETHNVLLYAGEDYHYEGVLPMPHSYPDDRMTVTVLTVNSNTSLAQETLTNYYEALPAVEQAQSGRLSGVKVCIDPGHQRTTSVETVPLGPNFTKQSTTTVGMAQGVVTKRRESIVTLEIGFLLRNALLAEGAEVIMTRESQDVFVGMMERADIPNDWGADFVLRLHCNSREDSSVQGIQIYCPYQSSYALAVTDEDTYRTMGFALLDAMKASTGATRGTCTLNNTYVGNNWSKMPSFLVEMGYLSNREEDLKMATTVYQRALVTGMVEGIYQLAQMRGIIEAE